MSLPGKLPSLKDKLYGEEKPQKKIKKNKEEVVEPLKDKKIRKQKNDQKKKK